MRRKKILINKENTKKISEALKGNIIIASIIDQAGIKYTDLEEYINPKMENLNSPFLFKDMEKAVKRIIESVDKKENILIYGDYDADGNTATAILIHFFRKIGHKNISYMIPSRLIDGYGISMDKISEIKEKNIDLIITVDCGIKNVDEIKKLNELGIDVILTDHHEQGDEIPDAFSVINPKVKKEKYPFKELSGAGVSFKLVSGINEKLNILSKKDIYILMLIASIGTIGDVMPLIKENRDIINICRKNLKINDLPNGLKELFIDYPNFNAEDIAYYIVPKINSSGRMGEEFAIKLLVEEDIFNAKKYKEKLEFLNEERKRLTEEGFLEIDKKILEEKIYNNDYIFVGKENLHEGVIGIIASKVSEKYNKAVSIYTNKNNGEMVASSRCINQDVNIYNFLEKFKKYFTAFGGHDFAAGFSFKKEDEEKIKDLISKEKVLKEEKILKYNNVLNLNEISLDLVKSMEILKPFGNKNEEPIFLFKNLFVKNIVRYPKITKITFTQKVGHKINLKTKEKIYVEKEIDAISFKNLEDINIGEEIDIYANLRINSFRGIENVQLFI